MFAASDLIALGAMKALREAGLRIPEDVAVAGFDDIAMASFTQPGLSTVQQDTRLAGEVLVDSLIGLIRGEAVESRKLQLPIDKVFKFADIGKAFEHMEANKHLGKIVVTI